MKFSAFAKARFALADYVYSFFTFVTSYSTFKHAYDTPATSSVRQF